MGAIIAKAMLRASLSSPRDLRVLLVKLGNMLAADDDENNLQMGSKEGISYILQELQSMQVDLRMMSEVPPNQLDPQVKLWASRVRDIWYKIERTIDSYMITIDIRGMSLWTNACPDIATEIERIRKEVEEMANHSCRYMDDDIAPPEPSVLYQDAAKLVGIDHSMEQIMELLSMKLDQGRASTSSEDKKMPRLVSIVGPGGMGKTTLVNVMYQKLKDHFDCTAFVSVSPKPSMKNILRSILLQVNRRTNHVSKAKRIFRENTQEVIDRIRDVLEGNRYLMIIDDIWDEWAWKELECVLVPNRFGSKIITTTRNTDVAKLCCSCDNIDGTVYQLGPLSDVESEKLFYNKVFGIAKCPPELKGISRKILHKCKGWPLAIISISSLLANKRKQTEDQWVGIYNSIGTGLENSDGVKDMWSVLSLSYWDMPSNLRACFLYLSMFSEIYVVERDDLIWRWIAEGFVQCKQDDDNNSLYEAGDEYFNELISRNMIQPADVDTIGRAQACIVHDVVLEFINFLSAKEGFITILNGQPFPVEQDNIIKRLSLRNSHEEDGMPEAVHMLPHVRTLVVSSQAASSLPSMSIFPVLRVLILEDCTSQNIDDVGILVLLRYLKLSQTYCADGHIKLPQEIGALKFLQILDLKDARIEGLPTTLVQLTQLRVLKLSLYSWDRRYEEILIQCLYNLEKLETLYISTAMNVSLDFMLRVELDTPYLRKFTTCFHEQNEHILRPGSVWRKLSLFSTLPIWINSLLSNLSDLSIMVKKLQQEDVEILAQFPKLVTLDLEVVQTCEEGKRLVISGDETTFRCLSNLKFVSRAMGLLFIPGAMQKLHKLYLCFSLAHTEDVHDLKRKDFHFGLENLTSLKAVEVEIDCRCAWPGELEAAEDALCTAIKLNKNKPAFVLRKHFEKEMMAEAVSYENEQVNGLSKIGPYGGNGGKSYDFMVPPDHHLETITLRSNDSVYSLAFSYTDHNGQHHNANPWGGNGGHVSKFHLDPWEYLTQVLGTIGLFDGDYVVRSLTFITNVKSYGPYGKDDGQNQFVVQARRNNCIVGFFGKNGDLIDSIGFYTRPL